MENLYFAINPEDYPHIETEKVHSLIVGGVEWRKSNFLTMSKFYEFLITVRSKMTYIKYEVPPKWTNNKKSYWEVYLLNGKNHRLDGPALIRSTYKETFNRKVELIEKLESYYIDGVEIEKEYFSKHPKVREVKLKRIIYKKDDDK